MRIGYALAGGFFIERQCQLHSLFAGIVGNQDLAPVELGRRIPGFRRATHEIIGLLFVGWNIASRHQQQRILEHCCGIASFGGLTIPEGSALGVARDPLPLRHHLCNQCLRRCIALLRPFKRKLHRLDIHTALIGAISLIDLAAISFLLRWRWQCSTHSPVKLDAARRHQAIRLLLPLHLACFRPDWPGHRLIGLSMHRCDRSHRNEQCSEDFDRIAIQFFRRWHATINPQTVALFRPATHWPWQRLQRGHHHWQKRHRATPRIRLRSRRRRPPIRHRCRP
ncbi:hypothetical protein D3C73_376930 [compost metagenome]